MRAEADATLKLAKGAVSQMNAAVEAISATAGTIAATGMDGGKSLADAVAAMNLKANPCEDFYEYACGGWINNTVKPGDSASWTRTFSEINKVNMEHQKSLYLRNDTTKFKTVSAENIKTVKDWHYACMDEATRDKTKLDDPSFKSLIQRISNVSDIKTMVAVWGQLTLEGIDLAPWDIGVGADDKDSNANIIGISQGGLGLPAREYYGVGEDNARFKMLRAGYLTFMKDSFAMAGVSTVAPQKILDFETELARIMWSKTQMRDPIATYYPTTIGNFSKTHLMWANYLKLIENEYPTWHTKAKVILSPHAIFKPLESLISGTEVEVLKGYSLRRMLASVMPLTTTQAGELNFNFYGKLLSGTKDRPPLWKRCVSSTTSSLWGYADQMFVEKHFGTDGKKLANEMIDSIIAAFHQKLEALTWMDATTKKAAAKKLNAMNRKVGFPDVWRAYPGMVVTNSSFLQNELSSWKVETKRNFEKMGHEVDKGEWHMNPSMTNAYYSPSSNEMAFPAGILQPPFFSTEQPMVLNFGQIGAVMGHELTHGFDDQGAQYNSEGNMKMWWSNESHTAFKKKTNCIEKQYEGIELPELAQAAPTLKVNGKLTLGENIADNGGVATSLKAFETWQREKDTPTEYEVDGKVFKSDALFWVATGQTWCRIATPESVMTQIRSDPHSPSRARVVGPVQNSDAFAKVMKCEAGTKMNPPAQQKCYVW